MPFEQNNISLDNRRFVELYLSNGRNAVAAYKATFPERAAKRDEKQIVGDANGKLKLKSVARYLLTCEERLKALDPLRVEKEEMAAAAALSAANELAYATAMQTNMERSAGVERGDELPAGMPAHQPLAMLHCNVTQPDLVGQSVEIVRFSKEWVLRMLETNVARAMQIAPVVDSKGNPTGEYVYNGAVANKAIEMIAKIEGHLVDRKIVDHRTLDDMTDEEIRARKRAIVERIMEEVGDAQDIAFREAPHGL